jgi:hypothetical protein
VPGVRARLAVAGRPLLLLLGILPSVLFRLMMADDAAGAGTENAVMPGNVPGHPADGGALQAPGRLNRHCDGADRHWKHQGSQSYRKLHLHLFHRTGLWHASDNTSAGGRVQSPVSANRKMMFG